MHTDVVAYIFVLSFCKHCVACEIASAVGLWTSIMRNWKRKMDGYRGLITSAYFLAEIPLRSPRKLFTFIIKKIIYRMKVSNNKKNNFEKRNTVDHLNLRWQIWFLGGTGYPRIQFSCVEIPGRFNCRNCCRVYRTTGHTAVVVTIHTISFVHIAACKECRWGWS